MIVAGIDPGLSGAIAVVSSEGMCKSVDVPVTDGEVNPLGVFHFLKLHKAEFVIIEHAQSMPKQGVASTFKYGQAFGTVLAAAQLLYVPVTLVKPQLWKRQLGLTGQSKAASREMATKQFQDQEFKLAKDHNRAEAALIAWWWLNHPLRADLGRSLEAA